MDVFFVHQSCVALLLAAFLSACVAEKRSDENAGEVINYDVMNILTERDVLLLRGVNVGVRRIGEPPYSFGVERGAKVYGIPIYDEFKTIDRIMGDKYYDVVGFAADNGVDSAGAFLYVKSFSDSVRSLFGKLKVYKIINHSDLGDFIIFEIGNRRSLVYLPKEGVVRDDYWRKFFANHKPLRSGWYEMKE